MSVIHFWRVWPPSAFFKASQEDQALAIAYYESKIGIDAWSSHVQALEQENRMHNLNHKRD